MLQNGKLRDLLSGDGEEVGIAKNVLDLPLGDVTVPIPPRFSDVSSDDYSHNIVKPFVNVRDTKSVTSWGTASTRNALSWIHIDDNGMATVVYPLTGSKWWVLVRFKKNDQRWDEMGDVSTFDSWSVHEIDEDLWEAEAVHLDSSTAL